MTASTPSPNRDSRLQQDALAWFVRRQDAGWRPDEELVFQAWLAEDPHHAVAYDHCRALWHQFDDMPPDLVRRMRPVGNAVRPADLRPGRPFRRRLLTWPVALAGGATGMAAVGMIGYFGWRHLESRPILLQSFHTERGQQRSLNLSDGSRLRLDTMTEIGVAYYRNRREVRLNEGQVVFDVRKEPGRPFHVFAGPLRVSVLGTRFSVRHTPSLAGNDGVRIAVAEGSVRVSPTVPASSEMLLVAGQQVAGDRAGRLGPVSTLPPEDIAPWQSRRVSFVDTPLGQALAEMERYRPTGLVVNDPRVAALRLSGTFDPLSPETLRIALPRVLPVRLRERDHLTEIVPAS